MAVRLDPIAAFPLFGASSNSSNRKCRSVIERGARPAGRAPFCFASDVTETVSRQALVPCLPFCAGLAVAEAIRSLGHDTAFVRDRDARMPDTDILTWAVAEARIVVTMDKDFGELVFRSGQAHAGVLLLRLEAARTAEKVRVVTEI